MAANEEQQSFAPDFDRSMPPYLWWNGTLVPWQQATIHLTASFWTGVTAIFEGIMSYWNADAGELYIWQLEAHLQRLLRSQKLMRQESPYTVAQLTTAIQELIQAIGQAPSASHETPSAMKVDTPEMMIVMIPDRIRPVTGSA